MDRFVFRALYVCVLGQHSRAFPCQKSDEAIVSSGLLSHHYTGVPFDGHRQSTYPSRAGWFLKAIRSHPHPSAVLETTLEQGACTNNLTVMISIVGSGAAGDLHDLRFWNVLRRSIGSSITS